MRAVASPLPSRLLLWPPAARLHRPPATVWVMERFAAVVLAGGAGRRLGGAAKPSLPVAGRSMLDRVLAAVAGATPLVVVGHVPGELPAGVLTTVEDPPGSGPVAAAAAGVALLPRDAGVVALLAADLPFLTPSAVTHLRRQLETSTVDGALYVDAGGRRQLLCGVWRAPALRAALDRLAARDHASSTGQRSVADQRSAAGQQATVDRRPAADQRATPDPGAARDHVASAGRRGGLAGAAVRALVAELDVREVAWDEPGPPPWFDCDTDDDLRQAEEWAR